MRPIGGQREFDTSDGRRGYAYLSFDSGDHRVRGHFADVDHQLVIFPAHGRRPNFQPRRRLAQCGLPAVRHGEATTAPIGRNVDTHMVLRVLAPGPAVPRRKHRPDEPDDRYGTRAAIAQTVDIPPRIAVGADMDVEVWSLKIAATACRAESVAIGTPAPGCVPPPAR